MHRPVITLTTDFGVSSPYVAQMKGVILGINPEANVVDISHTIPPQDVRQGSIVLQDVTSVFPPETIHVAVVDPGVGTDRKILYLKIADHHFVAPDNGLLSGVAKRSEPTQQIELTNSKYWRETISPTFHGRDIMAPVAAHLSLQVDPQELGSTVDKIIRLNLPEVHVDTKEIRGSVVSFDSFGNLISDIPRSLLKEALRSDSLSITCGNHHISEMVRTYGTGLPDMLVALIGSSGMLELSVINGSAAQRLGVEVGEEIRIVW